MFIPAPLFEVHLRCLFVRNPPGYWTDRLASHCKHDVQDAAGASRADSNPALFITFHLVFQKDVISGQHIFRVGATDLMIREMPFILLVPVELEGVPHCIYCTLLVHTQPHIFLSVCKAGC